MWGKKEDELNATHLHEILSVVWVELGWCGHCLRSELWFGWGRCRNTKLCRLVGQDEDQTIATSSRRLCKTLKNSRSVVSD